VRVGDKRPKPSSRSFAKAIAPDAIEGDEVKEFSVLFFHYALHDQLDIETSRNIRRAGEWGSAFKMTQYNVRAIGR
jgi:hypothetical protein